MVTLYCGTRSNQNAPIQLFDKLAGVEATEDPTQLGEEDGAQEPFNQPYTGSTLILMLHPKTDVVGNDVYHSSDPSDHEVDSDSDPDVDEIPDDIDDKGVNKDRHVNASFVGSQIYCIVIQNNPGAHMSLIDPDATQTTKLLEYPKILPACQMAVYSNPKELLVGQRFESKKECIFAIKRVLDVGRRLQLADTSCIYPEVADMGDTKIFWASYMHFNMYDRRSSKN
ncbi:hypothetical protein GOBAR_AA24878 [Gossypium barbadense]|uniref:Uncharacterized protein n=1 Tax=Gossypium barbadense TaxID=3634 RepID=A0A2P5WXJ0_GOSBA|nr:hypothetical protein GOBAR_AA24878 [Gossypium barbadense]